MFEVVLRCLKWNNIAHGSMTLLPLCCVLLTVLALQATSSSAAPLQSVVLDQNAKGKYEKMHADIIRHCYRAYKVPPAKITMNKKALYELYALCERHLKTITDTEAQARTVWSKFKESNPHVKQLLGKGK